MSQQINLFNPIFLTQKKYFSALAMLQALGLIMFGCVLFYLYALYEVAQLSKQAEDMGKRYAADQARLVTLSNEYSTQRSAQMLDAEQQQLEAEAKAQDAVLTALKSGAIGNTQGYSEFMRAFARQSINGLWITAFDIVGDGTQMSLRGAVLSPQLVPSYIQRLGREAVMRGKAFSTLQMQQPAKDGERSIPRYVEFSLYSGAAPQDEVKK